MRLLRPRVTALSLNTGDFRAALDLPPPHAGGGRSDDGPAWLVVGYDNGSGWGRGPAAAGRIGGGTAGRRGGAGHHGDRQPGAAPPALAHPPGGYPGRGDGAVGGG